MTIELIPGCNHSNLNKGYMHTRNSKQCIDIFSELITLQQVQLKRGFLL